MHWSIYRSLSVRGDKGEDWRFDDAPASVLVMGKTHGCSCCSHDEVVSLDQINDHIAGLEDELKVAKKARAMLARQERKRAKEQNAQ